VLCTAHGLTDHMTAPRSRALSDSEPVRRRPEPQRNGEKMDSSFGTSDLRAELRVGTRVDVHTRYDLGRWAPGFTIFEVRSDGYRIRRASDGVVLSETILADEIRVATPLPLTRRCTQTPELGSQDAPSRSTPRRRTGFDR
jgi:hypothetical protein